MKNAMKEMTKKGLLAALLAGVAGSALAEPAQAIKPGLWEIRHKTAMDGQAMPDMSEMMANVPPEMRGQMEAMMAKNGTGMTDKGVTVCITPEQAAGGEYGNANPDGHCEVTETQHKGNTTQMSLRCTDPEGEGETRVTRQSDTAWKSVTRMSVKQDGSTHTMNSEAEGRWLQADCGAVKPH